MTVWDVKDATGKPVETLAGLAKVLHTTPFDAAEHLLAQDAIVGIVPDGLLVEAKAAARKKPGDGTPPPISNGTFVSFSGGKGRVDLLVSRGKVPGVEDDVEGTEKSPAARVVVWKDGKPTREKRAFSTHTLKRIAPLDGSGEKATPAERLVAAVAAHESLVETLDLPEHARVTGVAVKAVYDRGFESWPGEFHTTLSPEDWALGRVAHFRKVAAGQVLAAADAGHDRDLLHEDHPLFQRVEPDVVFLTREDVQAQIDAIRYLAE